MTANQFRRRIFQDGKEGESQRRMDGRMESRGGVSYSWYASKVELVRLRERRMNARTLLALPFAPTLPERGDGSGRQFAGYLL